MKHKYQLYPMSHEERMVMEYLLLNEMEQQTWFGVIYLELWNTEGIICLQ